ncbi:NADPH-dependent FMN reductase [Thalassospira marina]|uniref:FMN reductase n=1 Tax=Thalassospira marina TaxID=2048283 RepID=A0ABM6Q6T7_9PROT|nr:NAD(P)H-dependent oxidoreductase [Thalassospira marina]AUG51823.1 FMN reductase [Thalassospira marina]
MMERLNLAIIYGSASKGRFCDTIVNWLVPIILEDGDFLIETIDPALIKHTPRGGRQNCPVTTQIRPAIAEADAYLIVTPEYNHSFTGELKLLIDSARDEWCRKPAGFVTYGGISGGLRAAEQLRNVFGELHVATIRETVSFANVWDCFGDDGRPYDSATARAAVQKQLADLKWWARALRDARLPLETLEHAPVAGTGPQQGIQGALQNQFA